MQLKKQIAHTIKTSEVEWKEECISHSMTWHYNRERDIKEPFLLDDNFYYESLSAKAPHALLPNC